MSTPNHDERLHQILDTLAQTHPAQWQAYKEGKATLGQIYDLVYKIFDSDAL